MAGSWESDEEPILPANEKEPYVEDDAKDAEDKIWEDDIDTPQNSDVGNPTEIFIAVMGLTGSGKSLFIKTVTGAEVVIGTKLNSCKFVSVQSFSTSLWRYLFLKRHRCSQKLRILPQ